MLSGVRWPSAGPPVRLLAVIVAASTVAAACAACGASNAQDNTNGAEMPEEGELRAAGGTPEEPPSVTTHDDISLPILAYEWYRSSTDDFLTRIPPDGFHPDSLPPVRVPDTLRLNIGDGSRPIGVTVTWFSEIADGEPRGTTPPVDCLGVGSSCDVAFHDDTVEVTIPVPDEARVATIELTYDVPSLNVNRPFSVVSYGLRLTQE